MNVLQSLSAHLKLLLDAPEQLWRLLEQHNYLHAAWLFLISRVVYRNLVRAGDDNEDDDAEIVWAKEDIRIVVCISFQESVWPWNDNSFRLLRMNFPLHSVSGIQLRSSGTRLRTKQPRTFVYSLVCLGYDTSYFFHFRN